jgi:hypothetical protein
MREPEQNSNQRDNTLLLGFFILLLLSPPLVAWWTAPGNVWYLPYLLWLGIILLIAWVQRRHHVP